MRHSQILPNTYIMPCHANTCSHIADLPLNLSASLSTPFSTSFSTSASASFQPLFQVASYGIDEQRAGEYFESNPHLHGRLGHQQQWSHRYGSHKQVCALGRVVWSGVE